MSKGEGKPETSVHGDATHTNLSPEVYIHASVLRGELRGVSDARHCLEPDKVEILRECFIVVADAAVANRAAIERVEEHSFLLLFRDFGTVPSGSLRAVRAGVLLQSAFLARNNLWQRDGLLKGGVLSLAVGVGSGWVIVATESDDVAAVPSLRFGEPLQRALRLCREAQQGEVLADEATYRAVQRQVGGEIELRAREIAAEDVSPFVAYAARPRRAGLQVVEARSVTDPVCGRRVLPSTAEESGRYQGKVYYFCSRECGERFAGDPPSWVDE